VNSYSHLEVERSKVKVTRPLDVVIENQPYLRTYGKGRKSPVAWGGGILWRPHYKPYRLFCHGSA